MCDCEKVHCTFVDLEKVHDKVNRLELQNVLHKLKWNWRSLLMVLKAVYDGNHGWEMESLTNGSLLKRE